MKQDRKTRKLRDKTSFKTPSVSDGHVYLPKVDIRHLAVHIQKKIITATTECLQLYGDQVNGISYTQ